MPLRHACGVLPISASQPTVYQILTTHATKGRLSACKRRPFRTRNTAFHNAKGRIPENISVHTSIPAAGQHMATSIMPYRGNIHSTRHTHVSSSVLPPLRAAIRMVLSPGLSSTPFHTTRRMSSAAALPIFLPLTYSVALSRLV